MITGQEAAQHVQTLQMKRPLIGVRQPDILPVISDQLDTWIQLISAAPAVSSAPEYSPKTPGLGYRTPAQVFLGVGSRVIDHPFGK